MSQQGFTMKENIMPRGGAREGAGRPPKPKDEKGRQTVAVSVSLYPEERERLNAVCREMEVTQSDLMRFIIERPWLLQAPAIDLDEIRRKVERKWGRRALGCERGNDER